MSGPRWLRLHFGQDLDFKNVQAFLLALLSSPGLGEVVFDVAGKRGQVVYRVGAAHQGAVAHLINTYLPGVAVTESANVQGADASRFLKASSSRHSLITKDPERATVSLLGALSLAGSGVARQRITVGKRLEAQVVDRELKGLRSTSLPAQLLEAAWLGNRPVPAAQRTALQEKTSLPGASCTVEIDAVANVAPALAAHWRSLQTPGLRFDIRRPGLFGPPNVSLNADELATALCWPLGDRSYPGLDRSGARTLAVRSGSSRGRLLARGNHPGATTELRLGIKDGLRHLHVLGPTGTGKSTLLQGMILQDIAARRPVVVVDPKGDLVDDILARVSHADSDRIVLMDPTRTDYIVGVNPIHGARNQEVAVDGLVNIFRNQYAASWGPRTEDILHSSLTTLAAAGEGDLLQLPRLLIDTNHRRQILGSVKLSPPLHLFWSWFEGLGDRERASVIAPVLNKVWPLELRSGLRAMLTPKEPFQLDRVFSERLVLLVALRKGLTGPGAAHLLGSLVVAQLWQAILQRGRIAPARRTPAAVYLDEFQDYTALPTDLAEVLAQARGLGAGLVLAHQNLAQLSPELRAAVLANAQSKVMFRLGSDDARTIAQLSSDLTPEDFMRLRPFEIYGQLLSQGRNAGFASGMTLPSTAATQNHRRQAKNSVKRFGSPICTKTETAPPPPPNDFGIGRKRGPK